MNALLSYAGRRMPRRFIRLRSVLGFKPSIAAAQGAVTIAWIGSPENLTYLEMIRPALARLTARHAAGIRSLLLCISPLRWKHQ